MAGFFKLKENLTARHQHKPQPMDWRNMGNDASSDLGPLKELVRRVARTFFDGPEIVVFDHMVTLAVPVLSDTDLGAALRLGAKEANKFCSRLVESRLLRMESKAEGQRGDGKAFRRTFYVLDYKLFVDVIKWKMMKMERAIRARIEKEMDNRGYICPVCELQYSTLEAMSNRESFVNVNGHQDFRFLCRIDSSVLEEDKKSRVVVLGNETLENLNTMNRPIMDLVRQCDSIALPKYDPAVAREQLAKKSAEKSDQRIESKITVELLDDTIEEKIELPSWHQYSTVGEFPLPPPITKVKRRLEVPQDDEYLRKYRDSQMHFVKKQKVESDDDFEEVQIPPLLEIQ